jgi:hypothetical protein
MSPRLAVSLLLLAVWLSSCNDREANSSTPIPTPQATSAVLATPSTTLTIPLVPSATLSPLTATATFSPVMPTPAVGEQVSITGWFNTVYNHQPHYSITDERGRIATLLLTEEATRPFGGPLFIDRKHVTITGTVNTVNPLAVRVLNIRLAE